MGYSLGCEPLRVWSRLEPRARRKSFDRVLRAEIYDPLWMFARQWQLGEFKGEDTGSPILAKLAVRTAKLDGFRGRTGGFAGYDDGIPLEARVERRWLPTDEATRVNLGRQWLRFLDAAGRAHDDAGGTPVYDGPTFHARFRERFPIEVPRPTGDSPEAAVARARWTSNAARRRYLAAVAGRAVDGVALAESLPDSIVWSALPAAFTTDVPDGHRDLMVEAARQFRAWLERVYTQPTDPEDDAWNASQLEYQFACRLPRPDGGTLTLKADEYASGRLDWYSFDRGLRSLGDGTPPEGVSEHALSVIPTPAQFPGQPHPRWWQMEDGSVDLGNIRADTTDTAKIIVAEFALVYGNNWFVIPVEQVAGSLAEVSGIVVTDVFGQRTLVRSATAGASRDWTRWEMFSLGRERADGDDGALEAHLFLPPVVRDVLESEPLESARMVRDEMTNTVWAIETRVPDGLGRGRDGHEAARRFAEALTGPPPPAPQSGREPPRLQYVLGNSVPENWIPFVPVHKPQDDRAVRLQRASMPRFLGDAVRPVRPLTRVLRPGLTDDDRQLEPYFIHEEEVPRAGVRLEGSYQRARWYDGTTFVWYGMRKRSGRGEGSSGLRFDVLDHEPPEAAEMP